MALFAVSVACSVTSGSELLPSTSSVTDMSGAGREVREGFARCGHGVFGFEGGLIMSCMTQVR